MKRIVFLVMIAAAGPAFAAPDILPDDVKATLKGFIEQSAAANAPPANAPPEDIHQAGGSGQASEE